MWAQDRNDLNDAAIGVILTELSSWPVLVAGPIQCCEKRPKACS